MNSSSLRRQLVLPYVLLVVFVSAAIGWVSYRAGEEAVQSLTERVMLDLLNRVGDASSRQLAGARTALKAAQPDALDLRRQPFPDDPGRLEERLWLATSLSGGLSNFVYFGGTDGRFVGVRRVNRDLVELMLRQPGDAPGRVYAASRPADHTRLLRSDDFDPRLRPWYRTAAQASGPVWSAVYNDFSSGEPTLTLAEPAFRADGSLAGVMATDVTLKALTDFMHTLQVDRNGIAFIVDGSGSMIATSGAELPFKVVGGLPQRMHVDEMRTPLLKQAYALVQEWRRTAANDPGTRHWITRSNGVEIAAARLAGDYGLDWYTVVAVPRSDFMGGATRSVVQAVFIALVSVVIALVLGLSILNRVLRDIRVLSDAARRIGDGEPLPVLNIRRRDEIGQLAVSFSEMEHNLRIDKLTAVFNRASLSAQIGALRRQLDQKPDEHPTFALLFIDLDRFKKVNDQYGHAAGDRVLVAVAARLKESVRVSDVVARYGGDEFVLLLKGVTDMRDVLATCDKVQRIVEQPVALDHITVSVGVSVGWALFPEDGKDVDKLLRIADSRMFDTKRSRTAER
jgi:diguanylate cyclase (GGDEF)-like protein